MKTCLEGSWRYFFFDVHLNYHHLFGATCLNIQLFFFFFLSLYIPITHLTISTLVSDILPLFTPSLDGPFTREHKFLRSQFNKIGNFSQIFWKHSLLNFFFFLLDLSIFLGWRISIRLYMYNMHDALTVFFLSYFGP